MCVCKKMGKVTTEINNDELCRNQRGGSEPRGGRGVAADRRAAGVIIRPL